MSPFLMEQVTQNKINSEWNQISSVFSVYTHVEQLQQKDEVVVVGFQMGHEQDGLWSVEDVQLRKKAFLHNFEKHCHNKAPLTIKVYQLVTCNSLILLKVNYSTDKKRGHN